MTKSEALFEEILRNRGIQFQKIPESMVQNEERPDYQVGEGDSLSYWEIKEIEENPEEKKIIKSIENGNLDSYSVHSKRVKRSIKKAFHQFESYGVTDHPCVVVLYDARGFWVKDRLFHQFIQSAILGNGHYMENQDGELVEIKRTEGLLTRKREYITAVAIMYSKNKEIILFHNPNASTKLHKVSILSKLIHQFYAEHTDKGLKWIKV